MKSKYLLFTILLCIAQQLLAQPKGEKVVFPSPQASQLGKFGGVNLNYSSGSPNVAIPIYTAVEGSLEVPISLAYQYSGFKPSDLPGWCGIGWALQSGGVITRVVKGRRDEINNIGYLAKGADISAFVESTPTYVTYQNLGIRENNNDNHPDVFSFQFMGHSGKFVFSETGVPRVLSEQKISISYVKGTESIYNDLNSFISWIITTEDGTKYTFGKYELSSTGDSGNTWDTSSWHLTEIVNVKGDRITFEYSAIDTTKKRLQLGRSDKIAMTSVGTALSNTSTINLTSNASLEIYLQKIKGSLWELIFNSSAYTKTASTNEVSTGRRLDNIQVMNISPSVQVKKFLFGYDSNMQLLSMGEEGKSAHQMQYYGTIPNGLDGYTTQVDYWGFYNGQTNTSLIPGDYTNDLEPRINLSTIAALQQITYPTKGSTIFEYEQNNYSYFGSQLSPFSTIVVENYGYSWQRTSSGLTTGANPPFTLTDSARVDIVVNVPPGGPFSECNNLNQDSFTLNLPAGTYTGDALLANNAFYPCNGRINQVGFNFGLTVKVFRKTVSSVASYGGIRVKSVKEYANPSASPVTKTYEYSDVLNTSRSSGIVGQKPVYRIPFTTGGEQPFEIYASTPFNPVGSFAHYYKDVKEIYPDFTTQYSFTSHLEYADTLGKYGFTSDYVIETGLLGIASTQVSDLGGFQSYDFMRSLPKKTTVRDLSNNIKQETIYSYERTDRKKIPVLHHEFLTTFPTQTDRTVKLYYTKAYYMVVGWPRKTSEKVTTYGSNNSDPVAVTTTYEYDSNHLQLKKQSVTQSNGAVKETNFTYPLDYSGATTNTVLQAMIAANMVSFPVEQVTKLAGKVVDASLTTYNSFTGNANKATLYLPYKKFRFNGFNNSVGTIFANYAGASNDVATGSYYETAKYAAYNKYGNPVSLLLNNSDKISYLWAYKGQYPVAEIQNADNAQLATGLGGTSIDAMADEMSSATVLSKINSLRSSLTSSLVTGYLYQPLVGLTQKIAPNGLNTYYNYDSLERLENIKDTNNQTVKSYKYNYATP